MTVLDVIISGGTAQDVRKTTMKLTKYIKFPGDRFVMFPKDIQHVHMAKLIGEEPESAGQVTKIGGDLICMGDSMTLNIASAEGDSVLLNEQVKGVL